MTYSQDLGLTEAQAQRLSSNPLAELEASGELSAVRSPMQATVDDEGPVGDDITPDAEEPVQEVPATSGDFKLEAALKEQFGITPDDLKAGIEYIKNQQSIQAEQQVIGQLGAEWGVSTTEVNNRFAQVVERFKTLPPERQAQLDNYEGVKQLWSEIQAEAAVASTNVRGGGSATQTPASYDFTQNQIDAMDEATRRRLDKKIQQAYATGRVKDAV